MGITIRDVAERSQVSVSTTSRALNGRSDVSKDVRERVLAAARDLNYTANQHARALKGVTSRTLGVVLHDARAITFNGALLRGIYDAATPHGYSVIVCDAGGSADIEQQAHQLLLEKRVDGVLVNSGISGTGALLRLAAANIPFVVLNRRVDDSEGIQADYVIVDAERGSYLAARHLLDLGHTRIVYQVLAPENVPSRERLPGYRRALAEHEIPFAAELIVHSNGLADTHQRVMEALTRLQPRPTAVIAFNDEHAVPILKALHDGGLNVPEDVAMVGQNNLSFAEFLVPPLTSVVHAVQQVGRQGTEILLQKLAWPEEEPWTPQRVVLEPTLIVRESSGRRVDNAPRRPTGE
jgi:DNA-binding LacI/PurR family transcriptional regulator